MEEVLWQLLRKGVAYSSLCILPEEQKWQQLQQAIFGLKAAQELGPSTVVRMLQSAARKGNLSAVSSLCGLAGAAQMDAAGAAQLLQAALHILLAGDTVRADKIVVALCTLEGSRRLGAAAVGQLLRVAVLARSAEAVAALCKLPAAAQALAGVLNDLLQLAAEAGDAAVTEALTTKLRLQ